MWWEIYFESRIRWINSKSEGILKSKFFLWILILFSFYAETFYRRYSKGSLPKPIEVLDGVRYLTLQNRTSYPIHKQCLRNPILIKLKTDKDVGG